MFSRLSIRRPVTTVMVTLMVFIAGIVSYFNLDQTLMPNVDLPVVAVSTTYVGAGPEEIENLVSRPLEESLGTVSNVDTINSVSSGNFSLVLVQFVDGTDIDLASVDLREVLDRVKSSLPEDASEPVIIKMDINATPINLGVTAKNLDLNALNDFLNDSVINRLERIEGVASVNLSGGIEKEIRVTVDPGKMAGYGLTTQSVAQVLKAENMNLPSGSLSEGDLTVQVRTLGELTSLDEMRHLPLATPAGSIIHLEDIANVDEVEADRNAMTIINGEKGILISIDKQSTANLVKVTRSIMEEMDKIQESYPGLDIRMLTDTAEYIQMALANVTTTALLSAVIAFFVLLLFLKNPVTSLVIAVSIPTSILATFALMYVTGMTMNIISMGGVAIGIGMLVDNSVVVLDSIYQYYERGYLPAEAAETGAKEVTMAVVASTLTTIAVFFPIAMIGGTTGNMMKNLSYAIIYSLLSSLAVSLTFVPMACTLLLRREYKKKEWKSHFIASALEKWDIFLDKLNNAYEKILHWALRHRKKTVLIVLLAFAGSLVTVPIAGTDFVEEMDEGVANITVELPSGTKLDVTEEAVMEVLYRLEGIPEADTVYANVGAGMMSSGTSTANITMNLVDKKERDRSTNEVCEEIKERLADMPGVEITAQSSGSAMGAMGGADVTFNVYGYDSDTLLDVEQDMIAIVSDIEGFTDVKGSTGSTVPEATITIDRSKASQYGITTAAIANTLNTAITGTTATEFKENGTEIDVVLRYDTGELNYLSDLKNLTVTSAYGTEVPLSDVAVLGTDESAVSIQRENQKNYITIEANAKTMSGGEAQKLVDAALADYQFPDGCTYEFAGLLDMLNESFHNLFVALIVAILLVYMIMASQFESLRYPAIVMFSMPLAITGAILGLFITGNTITMPAFMGFIMMVVNNGIVLIDYANQLMSRGMNCMDALTAAGPRRLRPILMTTLTTILGLLPMALSKQEGSEMMRSLSISVIFGLTLATAVTLVFIPVLYYWMNERKRKRNAKRTAKKIAKNAKKEAEAKALHA